MQYLKLAFHEIQNVRIRPVFVDLVTYSYCNNKN